MPLITDFEGTALGRTSLQPTQVVAGFKVFEKDGKRLFQVDTRGSDTRRNPGKQSQTFQLHEQSAHKLWKLLAETYGFR